MTDRERTSGVDESLVARVASLSEGSQRWLKTAIQAIRSSEGAPALVIEPPRTAPSERREATPPPERPEAPPPQVRRPAADLEDVITGKADLRDHLEAYPELSKEFEGLADVIDLLRETGERRRRRGEEILRDLLQGEGRHEDGDETPPS